MRQKAETAQELVYCMVKEHILAGHFAAGFPLRQEDLARKLGFSRLPLREALHRLSAEGLVVLRPHRGYVVASPDLDEITDIFDIRGVLEERAGHAATQRRTAQDVEAAGALLRKMDRLITGKGADIQQWSIVNRQFHARLYESSRRKHLCRVVMMLRDCVEPYIRMVVSGTGELARAQVDHHQIVEAFGAGDAKLVGRLCRRHCVYTARFLFEALRQRRPQDAVVSKGNRTRRSLLTRAPRARSLRSRA
jgi:DNA-binding GntR family transcriptional regulator